MKRVIAILGVVGLAISSCIKHEIIPAPVPTADLNAHFIGDIQGGQVEITENVLGYTNVSTKAQIILPPPSLSSVVYYSGLQSTDVQTSIKVGLGSLTFDSGIASGPTLTSFNSFFLANMTPVYSNSGTNGFEVVYRDPTGREWDSNENSTGIQEVEFSAIVQESDESGDYSSFTCYFDCWVYSLNPDSLAQTPPVLHVDSMIIENAIYDGWFQK